MPYSIVGKSQQGVGETPRGKLLVNLHAAILGESIGKLRRSLSAVSFKLIAYW